MSKELLADSLKGLESYIDKQEKVLSEVCEILKNIYGQNIKSIEYKTHPEEFTLKDGRVCLSVYTSLNITLNNEKQVKHDYTAAIDKDTVIKNLCDEICDSLIPKSKSNILLTAVLTEGQKELPKLMDYANNYVNNMASSIQRQMNLPKI